MSRPTSQIGRIVRPRPASAATCRASALLASSDPLTSISWMRPALRGATRERFCWLVHQAVVLGEVGGRGRDAVALEIAGARAEHASVRCEAAGDQAGILELADPDRQIDALLDQVDEGIGHGEVDPERRMQGEEVGQRRRDVQAPEHHRHVEAQGAARRRLQLGHRQPGLLDLGQDPPAALVVQAARPR